MPRPPKHLARDSRQAILDAAGPEFATRGYDATSVDRIARRAGVNKAMIYYHFRSKEALYQHLLREMIGGAAERVEALRAGGLPPERQVQAFIDAVAAQALATPLPLLMMREIASGSRHLDEQTLATMARVLGALAGMVGAGVAAGRFDPLNPLFLYFTILGPLVLFIGAAPVRAMITRLGLAGPAALDTAAFVMHLKRMAHRMLQPERARPKRRRRAASLSVAAPRSRGRHRIGVKP